VIVLRPYQQAAVDHVAARWRECVRRILLVAATGAGKCLGLGTPVLRYDGTIVAVEDVRPGDLLMGPDSKPRRVLGTTRGHSELYRVTPTKGEPWVCNDVHVLTLVHTQTDEVADVDLPTYLAETKHFRHCHKQFTPPDGIDFAPAEPLPLDPYFLGVWYGDGTHALHGVAVSKPDPEIEALMADFAERFGLRLRTDGTSCPTHHLSGERGRSNPLLTLLRRVVGDQSALPHAYLTASREDRAAFLAGLLDTDGYMHHGCYEIAQLRRPWADGIAFLARSLGLRALITPKVVNETTYWRVSISGDCSGLPLRIQRKQAPPRRQKKCATRTGITVEPIGFGEYAGFELDGDGRFLLGDFTVTHNTILAARFIVGAAAKGRRALFIVHRREIIAQAWGKIVEAGVAESDCGVIMGDGKITHPVTRKLFDARRPGARVQVASVQTLAARATRDTEGKIVATSWPAADLVFVDEAHHASSRTWSEILEHYRAAGATIIGLTATPERADGRGLDEHFDELHLVATPAELMDAGYLVRPRIFTSDRAPDLKGIAVRAGDYAPGELAAACDRPTLVGDIVAHYQRHGGGQRAVVFAAGVEHSRHLTEAFRAAGIAAEHLDGKTPTEERDAILTRLREGTTRVVSNVGVLTEGWDEPLVGCVILARPTKSLGLYLQMAGRGLRPAEGKSAALLDHAGCVEQHLAPWTPRDWSLAGKAKRGGATGGASPLKRCPSSSRSPCSARSTCRTRASASVTVGSSAGTATRAAPTPST
jgi:superfamily II DNA or RNA helicase